jgi:hypothetical protein
MPQVQGIPIHWSAKNHVSVGVALFGDDRSVIGVRHSRQFSVLEKLRGSVSLIPKSLIRL